MKCVFTALVLLSFTALATDHQVFLTVEESNVGNRVYWMQMGTMPKEWDGVIIKRRPASRADSPWKQVTPRVVKPCVVYDVDWENVIPDKKTADIYKKKLKETLKKTAPGAKYRKEGFFSYFVNPSGTDLKSKFRYHYRKWGSFAKVQMTWDIDNAFFIGMGFIDPVVKGTNYEYALFPVLSGITAEKPLILFDQAKGINYKVIKDGAKAKLNKLGDGIEIRIDYLPNALKSVPVTFVRFYRKNASTNEDFELMYEGRRDVTVSPNSGNYVFVKTDEGASSDKEYIYKFVPVLITGKELTEATTIYHYKPEE